MIYWNGCSFVQGMEVKEAKNHFPYLVGSHFKQDTWRNSKVGGSNDRILRTTTDWFAQNKLLNHNETFVLIGLTQIARTETFYKDS